MWEFILEHSFFNTQHLLGAMAASVSASSGGYFLWGWEKFFEELSAFLQAVERQEGSANMAFSEYIVERLQISIMNVSAIMHHLQSSTSDEDYHIHIDQVLFLPTTNWLTNISSIADVSTAGLQSSSGQNINREYRQNSSIK